MAVLSEFFIFFILAAANDISVILRMDHNIAE